MSAVHEARVMLAKYERGLAPQDSLICKLLAHIDDLEAENAALRKAIAAVRALCENAGFMCDEYANTENPAGENHDAVHVVDVLAALTPPNAENA